MNSAPCVMLLGLLSACIVRAVYKSQGQAYCEAPCDPNTNANHCRPGCVCAPRVDNPKLGTCVSLDAPIPQRLRDPRQSQTPTPKPGSLAKHQYSSQSLGPWKPALPLRPDSLGAHPLPTGGGSPGARPQSTLPDMSTANPSPSRLQSLRWHPMPQTPPMTHPLHKIQGKTEARRIPQRTENLRARAQPPARGFQEARPLPLTSSSPARRPLPTLPAPQTPLETNSRPGSPAAVTLPEYTEQNPYAEIN